MSELREKREWYEKNASSIRQGLIGHFKPASRFTCPCCGYPTLAERNSYEICRLCNWEDDGQDDKNSSEVFGGPNYEYSLDLARTNFEKYTIMYSPDNNPTITGGDSENRLRLKKQLISIFDRMRHKPIGQINFLWKEALKLERHLDVELLASIKQYESKNKP